MAWGARFVEPTSSDQLQPIFRAATGGAESIYLRGILRQPSVSIKFILFASSYDLKHAIQICASRPELVRAGIG